MNLSIFKYDHICSRLNESYRRQELNDVAERMGVHGARGMSKRELCISLSRIAENMLRKKTPLPCANHQTGENMYLTKLTDIPPYLIYIIQTKLNIENDDKMHVQNAPLCADIRDLVKLIRMNQRFVVLPGRQYQISDNEIDDILARWNFLKTILRPEAFVDQDEEDEQNMMMGIRPDWYAPLENILSQLYNPGFNMSQFSALPSEVLIRIVERASLYSVMNVTHSDVTSFKQNPTISNFTTLIRNKLAGVEGTMLSTFYLALEQCLGDDWEENEPRSDTLEEDEELDEFYDELDEYYDDEENDEDVNDQKYRNEIASFLALPVQQQRNRIVVQNLLETTPWLFKYATAFQNDRDLFLQCYEVNFKLFQFASEQIKSDGKFLLNLMELSEGRLYSSRIIFRYMSDNLKDDYDFMVSVLLLDGEGAIVFMEYASERLCDDEAFALLAVEKYEGNLKHISSRLKHDWDFLLTIFTFPRLSYIYPALSDEFPEHIMRDERFLARLVKINGNVAVQYAGNNLLHSMDFWSKALHQNPSLIGSSRLPNEYSNSAFLAKIAIKADASGKVSILKYLSPELQNTESIVYMAVKRKGKELEYASLNVRSNPRIVKTAVTNDPESFIYLHQTFFAQIEDTDLIYATIKRQIENAHLCMWYKHLKIPLELDDALWRTALLRQIKKYDNVRDERNILLDKDKVVLYQDVLPKLQNMSIFHNKFRRSLIYIEQMAEHVKKVVKREYNITPDCTLYNITESSDAYPTMEAVMEWLIQNEGGNFSIYLSTFLLDESYQPMMQHHLPIRLKREDDYPFIVSSPATIIVLRFRFHNDASSYYFGTDQKTYSFVGGLTCAQFLCVQRDFIYSTTFDSLMECEISAFDINVPTQAVIKKIPMRGI